MLTASALPQIESALAKTGDGLAFPPALEVEFQGQRLAQHTATIRRCLLLYVVLSLVGLVCDYLAGIPVLRLAAVFRAGICIPATLLAIYALKRTKASWVQGTIAMVPMILLTVLVGMLARLGGGPLASNLMILPALCIFTQTLVAPLPFRYAARGFAAALACFACVCLVPLPVPFHEAISAAPPMFTCGQGWQRSLSGIAASARTAILSCSARSVVCAWKTSSG